MAEPMKTSEAEKTPEVISFHYEKSSSFQSFHVDGAFGGISPRLNINMALFAERGPIPRRVDQEISADGTVGKELNREGKDGILRELQCNLVMDYRAAKVVHEWLGKKIADVEGIRDKLNQPKA